MRLVRIHILFFSFHILLGGISVNTWGQTFYNLGGDNIEVFVATGETLTFTNEVDNRGDIINNGSIFIGSHWLNLGNYQSNAGSFVLNSINAQEIAHNGQNFHNLIIGGPGEKQIVQDLFVTNSVDFQQGLVVPNQDIQFYVSEGASVLGGSDDSYLDGRLIVAGTGDLFFPIGKNGDYSPVNLYDLSGNNPVTGLEVFSPHPNPQVPRTLQAISPTRYWQKTMLAGNIASGIINLPIQSDEGINDILLAVVTEADEPGGSFTNLGQSEVTGELISGSVTSDISIADGDKIYALGQEIDLTGIDCVPNAFATFSPDANERVVKVYCNSIAEEDFVFQIFNKWGLLIYETNSLEEASEQGWDGTNQSTGQQEKNDVYRYILKGKFRNGNTLNRVGTITKLN